MQIIPRLLLTLSAIPLLIHTGVAQEKETSYLSIKSELVRAIERGNSYLKKQQTEAGHWGDSKYPALTALALTSALRSPSYQPDPAIDKGYQWLISQQKRDGGIYSQGLGTYNTATSITALVASEETSFHPIILRARNYLIRQQTDWETKGETDTKFDGGIGYGGSYEHSDMSNTHLSIEALKLSQHIAKDGLKENVPDLNWEAAIEFISRTQNLQKTNDQPDIGNDGSFVYFPGNSKAGHTENADGSTSLRGYGSMSYAGLLSMIYADLDASDPRVTAVTDWLNNHFTVTENPGLATKENPDLGQQGLYYYYHAMAKALAAADIHTLTDKNGKQSNWRNELANQLLKNQREDGSWINANNRWWEGDPTLVTAYAVLTLEQIYDSIFE
ncbi:terpene cyclase/mutase family protein [Akkermansiaceae bacterium]|nr:terpene cyclase/mutase family protein [Akkermansiaceae bacterium]